MRFTRDWGGNRFPVHCCLLDAECWRDYREFYAPMGLYLHFLKRRDGYPVHFTIWGGRRHDRWLAELFADGGEVITGPPCSSWESGDSGAKSTRDQPM